MRILSLHRWFAWLLALAAIDSVPALADWPHLRGSNYDGQSVETGLAADWPEGGPPRLWSRALGQGYSGFVVADDKLFTQRQGLGGQSLLCLDPASGQTVWEYFYDGAWQPKGAYPGPYATPTCHAGKVYFASPSGLVGCVEGATGTLRWSVNVRERFGVRGHSFGYAATPLVEAGRVILPVGAPDASLVALDAADGATLWKAGSDPASYCPAYPINFQGRRLIVGYLENALLLIDLIKGDVLLRRPLSAGYDEHSAWPLYREPYLLLTGPFRVPATCLELLPSTDATLTTRPQWSSREFCNDVVSSVLYRDHVYGFDLKQLQASAHRPSRGTFRCLDWKTGRTCWSTEAVGQAALLVADEKLLMLNDSGELILANADSAAYRELGRVALFPDEICWTPPTLWQGRLFVRSPSQAVCLFVGQAENTPPSPPATAASRPGAWYFDVGWLLPRERDYPNDAFAADELWRWYVGCLVVFAGAGLAVGIVRLLGVRCQLATIFWSIVFVLGVFGPLLASHWFEPLLLTWPVALYTVFHAAVRACWHAEQGPTSARWTARLAVVVLLLVGYGYYELCKRVGMFVAWSFLAGYPAAFLPTLLAVRTPGFPRIRDWGVFWALIAFTLFFVAGPLLLIARSWMAGH